MEPDSATSSEDVKPSVGSFMPNVEDIPVPTPSSVVAKDELQSPVITDEASLREAIKVSPEEEEKLKVMLDQAVAEVVQTVPNSEPFVETIASENAIVPENASEELPHEKKADALPELSAQEEEYHTVSGGPKTLKELAALNALSSLNITPPVIPKEEVAPVIPASVPIATSISMPPVPEAVPAPMMTTPSQVQQSISTEESAPATVVTTVRVKREAKPKELLPSLNSPTSEELDEIVRVKKRESPLSVFLGVTFFVINLFSYVVSFCSSFLAKFLVNHKYLSSPGENMYVYGEKSITLALPKDAFFISKEILFVSMFLLFIALVTDFVSDKNTKLIWRFVIFNVSLFMVGVLLFILLLNGFDVLSLVRARYFF